MIRPVFSSIIILSVIISASLHGMDDGPAKELSRVTELLKHARHLKPITKVIYGFVSAIHSLDDHTIIVESYSPDDTFSTLHVYNMKEKTWSARAIDADERTLAECGF